LKAFDDVADRLMRSIARARIKAGSSDASSRGDGIERAVFSR
jgi:hypothetical protein